MAGGHKHKWTWIIKYDPSHFGEKGFHPPTSRKAREINLNELSSIAERLSRSGSAVRDEGRIVIDLRELGYRKVVGKGRLAIPLKIIASRWTPRAEEKIRASNSVIVTAD